MAKETKGKSKTDVTARDKSGRATVHTCMNCNQRIAIWNKLKSVFYRLKPRFTSCCNLMR